MLKRSMRSATTMSGLVREGFAESLKPRAGGDGVALTAATLRSLSVIAADARGRGIANRRPGFANRLAIPRGITVLSLDRSGDGTTIAADSLARSLGRDLYRVDLSTVLSPYVGETEKNLRRIFDAAESAGAILLFDEADALFGKRTDVKDSHDRYANLEVGYLLQRMEAYPGIAILAVGGDTDIDRTTRRRFRHVLDIPCPPGTRC